MVLSFGSNRFVGHWSSSPSPMSELLAAPVNRMTKEDTQKAFTENDITRDVLLDLDAAELKDKIGITVFGKRTRLLNAIADLKQGGEKPKEKERD
ncbi:hypothetical protein FRC07_001676 [Ceratobasidium sp. 392]|nr:hypothetical protein FRC07_001676 [Ceratobasidium sp. 392]